MNDNKKTFEELGSELKKMKERVSLDPESGIAVVACLVHGNGKVLREHRLTVGERHLCIEGVHALIEELSKC